MAKTCWIERAKRTPKFKSRVVRRCQRCGRSRAVLRKWQITSCQDFGQIVFAMVDAGLMHKNDEDSIKDFADVFDFADAFSSTLNLQDRKG